MNNTVLFLDSGVGGLPYRKAFLEQYPGAQAVYIADTKNFPYGSKTKEELVPILHALTAELMARFAPTVIVIACNTASVTALDALRKNFPAAAFAGTVPAVKPAVTHSKTGFVGVLGTERTIADPYIDRLLSQTEKRCTLCRLAAPELVDFVEHDFWNTDDETKLYITKKYIDYFREHNADGIVLGCTHFLLMRDFFKQNAGNDISIFDSIDGVCGRTAELLGLNRESGGGALVPGKSTGGCPDVLLTGPDAHREKWRRVSRFFGITIQNLAEEPSGKGPQADYIG